MKHGRTIIVVIALAFFSVIPQPVEGAGENELLCFLNCRLRFGTNISLYRTCINQCIRVCNPPSLSAVTPTPPVCRLAARTDSSITIEAQDNDGLAAIAIILSENANTVVPSFAVGTTASVFVQSTKIDPKLPSRVELAVIDAVEPCVAVTLCDPVLTSVVRTTGKPVAESYFGLPQEEDAVTISNGSPGLAHLDVIVNGIKFKVKDLTDGEERTINISPAMLPGDINIVTLKTQGKPGASAGVLIWNGEEDE